MNISKIIVQSAAVVCLGLVFGSAALAQTTTERTQTNSGTTTPTVETRVADSSDRNWSWIGLLGLAGLAGLMRRKEEPRRDTQDLSARPAVR